MEKKYCWYYLTILLLLFVFKALESNAQNVKDDISKASALMGEGKYNEAYIILLKSTDNQAEEISDTCLAYLNYYKGSCLYFLKKLDKFISLHITAPVSEKGEINSNEIKSWVQNDISLELYLPYYKLFKQQENINLELDSGYLLLDESEDDLEIYSRLYNEKVNLLAHSYDLINDEDVFNPNLNDVVNNYNIVMKGLCEEDILEETKYDKARVRK